MTKRNLVFGTLATLAIGGYLFLQMADHNTSAPIAIANVSQSVIDLRKFEAIKPGMTLSEVRAIVGSHGTLQSQVQVGEYSGESYIWQNPGGSNAIVTFAGGRVQTKAQALLR